MKYPIGLSIILNALAAISILSGCSDYLDREYDSFIDNEMTFTSYERTSKFLVNAYRYLPDGFNRIGSEAMLDAATDDAAQNGYKHVVYVFQDHRRIHN